MYHLLEENQIKYQRKYCAELIDELTIVLRDYDIISQFFLVGSGARNMVTQNDDEPIDFDYNLNIISCPDWEDTKQIKESVRLAFNKVLRKHRLFDVNDSTSSLTTKCIYLKSDPNIYFSIDLCIVTKDDQGYWNRLIHDKSTMPLIIPDRYIWNIAPNSREYQTKAKLIKRVGKWDSVRDEYLYLKNKNLSLQSNKHSFICYIEAVNNIYNHLKQTHII